MQFDHHALDHHKNRNDENGRFDLWHTVVSLINRISVKSYPDICRVLSLEAAARAKSALSEI